MRRNAAAVVCSLALLACRPDDVRGEDESPGEDEPPGDGDGDGDGDSDGADPEPVCDVSQFPQLVPEWIVQVESPIEGATPSVSALEVTADAIFAAGRHNIGSAEPPGFIERRTLAGELEWSVDIPKARGPFVVDWDGTHIYASFGYQARRWTADGIDDDWRFDAEFIADMEVGEEAVAVVGTYTEPWGHPDYADAYFGALTKTVPPEYGGLVHATVERNDHGHDVVRSPWGGWIASGTAENPYAVWLWGFAGSQFSGSLRFDDRPHVHSMVAYDDALLVLGRVSRSSMWLSVLTSSGEEISRKDVSLCGAVVGSLRHLTRWNDLLWGLGTVRSAPQIYTPVLVQLGFEGMAVQVYALHSGSVPTDLSALRVTDSGFYVGGFSRGKRTIGKVYP